MVFLWVNDDNSKEGGLTRKEVEVINKVQGGGDSGEDEKISFKESRTAQKPEDLVLEKGLHFLIVLKQMGASKVVLDHRFGETKKKSPPKPGSQHSLSSTMVALANNKKLEGSGETSEAPMVKKVGPLSISNIGLQFLNNTLYILLDATFELGLLSMSMLGFGIGVSLKGFNLHRLPDSLEVELEGLTVGFEKTPVTLAGLFRHNKQPEIELYMGGITVGFVPYSFLAAGYYGKMKAGRKTVFVFAKLTGPLITLGFAEISGICGGFGYNNTILFPTISEVPTYPLIDNGSLDSDPSRALETLTQRWVQPKDNVNWFAVGLSVKAFGLLDVVAVVAVEFNPYVKLGIFALCQAGFPTKATADKRFLYIGLGISAVVDFHAGTMKVEGQLTPDSFVLAPSCHLTGGFGLFYWFGNSERAGDWVLTIGGYHPSFARPIHYPNPPRLGISWTLDDGISIIGQSYFAITPKCCMAGTHLRATLSAGPLKAWFDAQANMLMNFNPFFFRGDARVSVGVSFTLWLWICTIYIKIEIGASLYLEGPPFRGTVYVNFWVFGFSVNFGPEPDRPKRLDLPDFWKLCTQDGVDSLQGYSVSRRLRADAAQAGAGDHVLAAASGLLPTSEDDDIWDVRGGVFSFTIQSRFPIKKATVQDHDKWVGEVRDDTGFYAKPMGLKSPIYSSDMKITITKEIPHNALILDVDATVDKWRLTCVPTNVPDMLWGIYEETQDPTSRGYDLDKLLKHANASTKIQLTMSITVSSPNPVLADDKIPQFNFIHAMATDVNGTDFPNFLEFQDTGKEFEPNKPADGPAQWSIVQKAWKSAKESNNVLDTWRKAVWGNTKIDDIQGNPPQRALDKFLMVYMAAPLMCHE